jgi:uncharacterized protein (DUF3820 family)
MRQNKMRQLKEVRKLVRKLIMEKAVSQRLLNSPKALRVPYGKHKGRLFNDVPDDYLKWLTVTIINKGDNRLLLRNILNHYANLGFISSDDVDDIIYDKKLPPFLDERDYVADYNQFAFEDNARVNDKLLFLAYDAVGYKYVFRAKNGGIVKLPLNFIVKAYPNREDRPKLQIGKFYKIVGGVVAQEIKDMKDGPIKITIIDIESIS